MNHYLSPMQPCANCNNPFESAYCPACGQKRVHAGIQLKEVITDFASGLFNVDAPILRTLREFIVAPGQMTRAWLAGKRISYTPPVRYFLFGIAYYFIMRWLLNWDPVDSAVEATNGIPTAETSMMRVNHWMSRNVNLLIPIWLIMLATFDRALFPRTTLRWVERLIHYLFAAGTYLMVSTTLIPLIKLFPSLQLINFFVIFSLIIWACIALHQRTIWNVIKAVVMVPLSFILYVFICTVIVSLGLGIPLGEVFVRPAQ